MKKNIIKVLILTFLLVCNGKLSFADTQDVSELHVFIEVYATDPALSQMIQYAKLPANTRKIIAWHRFPQNHNEEFLKKYNTRVVELPSREFQHYSAVMAVLNATLEEMEADPKVKLHLHANMTKMEPVIKYFLRLIPGNRIARLHLYEDGYGGLFKSLTEPPKYLPKFSKLYTPEELQNTMTHVEARWRQEMALQLHKIFPVTYYILGWNKVKDNFFYKPLQVAMRGADVVDINFDELALTLSESEKQMIYRLANFDEEYYSRLMKGKKTFVFALGYYGDIKHLYAAERRAFSLIGQGAFPPVNAKDYLWFYKPHPSYLATEYTSLMRTQFPDIIEIPAQIPFEVFILAGLKPTYTAGRESSLFYALSDEDILFIIKRNGFETTFPYLSDIQHVGSEKFLNIDDF